MPNWCANYLAVEGDRDKVDQFIDENKGIEVGEPSSLAAGEVRELPLSFEAAHPTPRDENGELFHEGDEEKGLPDWYDWRISNWGTKWDLDDNTIRESLEGGTFYKFDTAWAPPVEWVAHVSEKYPDLKFHIEYEEPGMAFGGRDAFQAGEHLLSEEWDVTYNEETEEFERA